jgi:signal transduction histidine kinase
LEIVAQELSKLFKVGRSSIALLNKKRTELKVVTAYSENSDEASPVGLVFPIEGNLASMYVIESGQALIVDQPQTNFLTEAMHELLEARHSECLMMLPLLARSQVIGTITLDTAEPDRKFTANEKLLAGIISLQIAGMIEHMRLLDQDLHRSYEKLKAMDNLKSGFIGVITHELRSPFVAASLSVELLERYAENKMLDEIQRQTKDLKHELAEGRQMINNVISFASLMSKQSDLKLTEVDFKALTKSVTAPLAEMAHTRQISLSFNFSPDLPPVYVDEEKMSEAVYHLVYNAIKFNHQDGWVRIECYPAHDNLVFRVKDTGQGLPPDKLKTIWEAFAQNSDDLKRGIEGLGLGLALVKLVVEAHGGQVAATSKVDAGSTFGFHIPFGTKKPEEISPQLSVPVSANEAT